MDGTCTYEPPVQATPGLRTLKNFLATAMMPVGTTLYIYGGGWDLLDAGGSMQTRSIGISDNWVRFFQSQDENYTYREKEGSEYSDCGLDCSGFLGWTIYNVMNTEDGNEGFVVKSTKMAKMLAQRGWGTWTRERQMPGNNHRSIWLPGDVISISGHVWICLGTCADGSIPVLHSTAAPSYSGQPGGGVELSALGADKDCEAYRLADTYMSHYYPQWYARYPAALKDYVQYTSIEHEDAGRFSWNLTGKNGGLTDPDSYHKMSSEQIMADLYGE